MVLFSVARSLRILRSKEKLSASFATIDVEDPITLSDLSVDGYEDFEVKVGEVYEYRLQCVYNGGDSLIYTKGITMKLKLPPTVKNESDYTLNPDRRDNYSDIKNKLEHEKKIQIEYKLIWNVKGILSWKYRSLVDCQLYIKSTASTLPTLRLVYRTDGSRPERDNPDGERILFTVNPKPHEIKNGEYSKRIEDTLWQNVPSNAHLRLRLLATDAQSYSLKILDLESLTRPSD